MDHCEAFNGPYWLSSQCSQPCGRISLTALSYLMCNLQNMESSPVESTLNLRDHFNEFPNDAGFGDTPQTAGPVELKVTGRIPTYVCGVLYRAGPGSYNVPLENGTTFKIQHW